MTKEEDLYERFPEIIEFRSSISRSEGYYGQNRLTLRKDGRLIASALGGNYDMMGYCLGEYIEKELGFLLTTMPKIKLYGLKWENPNHRINIELEVAVKEGLTPTRILHEYNDKAWSDVMTDTHTKPIVSGSCGESSIKSILKNMGLNMKFEYKRKGVQVYKIWRE